MCIKKSLNSISGLFIGLGVICYFIVLCSIRLNTIPTDALPLINVLSLTAKICFMVTCLTLIILPVKAFINKDGYNLVIKFPLYATVAVLSAIIIWVCGGFT